ncbi:PREDICTED: WASH complex subunit strumpellin isoform X2 [Polistes dominula]|uniref:WASH complex subunit strumpellin isoform X2 n=1 Tax=Polistes dominula TaxID=743375 RepID=A0ABM1J5M4_POLDO|nr:PREDICTED: WASH complex subunit strumpellin isoform X2 [Polistes dominula]
MGDYLTINNVGGQTLLRLVSRGNAIIAELMRLKDYVPPIFSLDTKQVTQKYGPILNDFSYFKATSTYEKKIEDDPVLQETDEEIRNNFSELLSRFYLAFESIHKYITDLNFYIEKLNQEDYQSSSTVESSEDGKQLMCEAVYLYGVMLLLVDNHFEGRVRERLLVSYYRYNAQESSSTKVDDICMLLRSTGYSKIGKRPSNYPEDYFGRIPLNASIIEGIVGCLRFGDLYNQRPAFHNHQPEYRNIALSTQASMLVIILCFIPDILNTQTAVMREIVDKFFSDNWVISIYMGIVINLKDWWLPYKAARTALNNNLETSNIRTIAQKHGQKMEELLRETEEVELAGTLDENAIGSLVNLVRDCNVTLRWILLHTTSLNLSKRSRSLQQLVITESKYTEINCLRLLLNTAQIEQDVKQKYKELLVGKETKWLRDKEACVKRIIDLAQIFGDNKSLDGVEKIQDLHAWFMEISKHINSLQQEDSRKIVQLLQALEYVQEFHQLENNLHVSQYLSDTREILHNMLRTGNIAEDTIINLNIVTDCTYAWNIMETFTDVIQLSIKKNPPTVIKLKALFLKMAKLTYDVSVFTKGVLSLRSVSLGVLRVDSHRLLEDGIRQELVKQVTLALQNGLIFDSKSKVTLPQKLKSLASIMDGYRKSFQYIQDYININSLKIWHEEIIYIIDSAIEEEQRGSSWIPGKAWGYFSNEKHPSLTENNCLTFIGRLTRELIRITDPRNTVYIEHALAWCNIMTLSEIIDHRVFTMILDAIGTPALAGMDKLISFYIVIELENVINYIEKEMRNKQWSSIIDECLTIVNSVENPKAMMTKLQTIVGTHGNKMWLQILDWILKIGHYQILRRKIAYELNTACKFEAKHMEAALQTLNTAILSEIKSSNLSDDKKIKKSDEIQLLHELSLRLDWAGISDPLNKSYIKPPHINNISFVMFLFTVSQLGKLYYCNVTASLLSKKSQDHLDAVVFVAGIQTMLRQFHISITFNYIKYICMYILSLVTTDSTKVGSEAESESTGSIRFLDLFVKYSGIPRSYVFHEIPNVILDHCEIKTL